MKNQSNNKKESTYKINVLKVNALLKKETKSLGFCRAILLSNSSEIELCPMFTKLLRASKKQANYKELQKLVRTSKNGNYSPFYLLQTLHKHQAKLQDVFAKNAKKQANETKLSKAA